MTAEQIYDFLQSVFDEVPGRCGLKPVIAGMLIAKYRLTPADLAAIEAIGQQVARRINGERE